MAPPHVLGSVVHGVMHESDATFFQPVCKLEVMENPVVFCGFKLGLLPRGERIGPDVLFWITKGRLSVITRCQREQQRDGECNEAQKQQLASILFHVDSSSFERRRDPVSEIAARALQFRNVFLPYPAIAGQVPGCRNQEFVPWNRNSLITPRGIAHLVSRHSSSCGPDFLWPILLARNWRPSSVS
jgi:hypothetical protein